MALRILKPTKIVRNIKLPNNVAWTKYTRSIETFLYAYLQSLKLAGNTEVSRQDLCAFLEQTPGLVFKKYNDKSTEMRFVTEAINRWILVEGGTYTGTQSKVGKLTF